MLFMIFAGSLLAQDSSYVFVHGNVFNLGENTVTVDVLLSDGQSASAVTWGGGYYSVQFELSDNGVFATSSITNCEGNIVSNTGQVELFGTIDLDLNYCGNEVIGGCMDSTANNYDENATYDDGSCDYCDNVDATLYVCTFQNGGNVGIQILGDGEVIFEQDGFDDLVIEYIPICLEEDVCYEVNMSNSNGTGWYGGYYWINIGGAQIATDFLDDGLSSESTNFSLNGACPIEGCTDSNALNYDSEAEIDDGSCILAEDCDDTLVVFEIEVGVWSEEMSWYVTSSDSMNVLYSELYDGPDGTIYYSYACLTDGCYQLHMFDGFGDGWSGGNINVIVDGVVISTGELPTGNYAMDVFGINTDDCEEPIGGCTVPTAINYNSEATYNDGSCIFDNGCECTQDYEPVCAYSFDIFTGDSVLTTYTNICWAQCDGASYAYDGPCDPADVFGCTDPLAINFNANATADDGSCIYAEDCDDNLVVFTMATSIWGDEIGWTIGSDSLYFGNYQDNSITTDALCLEDGCYDIYMMDSFGDGWNGAELTIEVNGEVYTTTLASGSGGVFTFGINTDDCLPVDVYGCTDPLAVNFDYLATIDDGSCFYGNGNDSLCMSNFFLFPDSLSNTIWAVNVSTGMNLEYLWDFGDGTTSTEAYPTHTYEEDGPYAICLTVTSASAGMIICEDTYCDSVGTFLFPGFVGDGVGMAPTEGFTINIVEDIADSVEEIANVQDVQVYPNPANNNVSISLSATQAETLQVKLYSINGQQLSSQQWSISSGLSTKNLDLMGLEAGIYMISITGEHTQLQERVIKL